MEIKTINQLQKVVKSYQAKANNISTSYGDTNITNRRANQLAENSRKKDRLIKIASIAQYLITQHELGAIERNLNNISTGPQIEFLLYSDYPKSEAETAGYANDYWIKEYAKQRNWLKILQIENPESFMQVKGWLKAIEPMQGNGMDPLAKLLIKNPAIRSIPGFFPTPDKVCEQMVEDAAISKGMLILEPSAGIGSIADAVNKIYSTEDNTLVECWELIPDLCAVLKEKGHIVFNDDIMNNTHYENYDRVIMNPPFEKFQDIMHIRHCFNLLKPGGRMVAIASMSWTFNTNKVSEEFRTWLGFESTIGFSAGMGTEGVVHTGYTDNLTSEVKQLPDNTFASSFNKTNVATTYMIINKR